MLTDYDFTVAADNPEVAVQHAAIVKGLDKAIIVQELNAAAGLPVTSISSIESFEAAPAKVEAPRLPPGC